MKRTTLFLTLPALIGLTSGAFAQEKPQMPGEVTLLSGQNLKGVELISVDPDGLRVRHSHGGGKLKLEDLPEALQERFKPHVNAAAASRETKRREQNEKDAAARRAGVLKIMEATKDEQQRELERQRREIFAIVEAGGYDFVAVDSALRRNIEVWKEATREDLAAVLEEDRQLIKDQQANRPGTEQQRTVAALQERIQSLEQTLQQVQQTPPPAVPASPEYITETVYIERPVPVLSPVFISPPATIIVKPPIGRPPVHPHPPHPRPPGQGRHPGYLIPPVKLPVPVSPSPPATVTPVVRPPQVRPPQVRPATGGTPRTVRMQPGGAQVSPGMANGGAGVSGAHLWNR